MVLTYVHINIIIDCAIISRPYVNVMLRFVMCRWTLFAEHYKYTQQHVGCNFRHLMVLFSLPDGHQYNIVQWREEEQSSLCYLPNPCTEVQNM